MIGRGAVYVAYGQRAIREARLGVPLLRAIHPDLPIWVLVQPGEPEPLIDGATILRGPHADAGARMAKLLAPGLLADLDQIVYLDADTRVRGDISTGFAMLDDGWDIVLAPSTRQGLDVFGHLSVPDRDQTIAAVGSSFVLALQCGVMFYRRSPEVLGLFTRWLHEWERFRDRDQGAFVRALYDSPIRIWLLGRAYNGGDLVEHHFGAATRR